MPYQNSYTQNPTPKTARTHNIEVTFLIVVILAALAFIALSAHFFYQFLQSHKAELDKIIYYSIITITLAILALILFTLAYIAGMYYLRFMDKKIDIQANKAKFNAAQANNLLIESTQQQINDGLIYLSEQQTKHGKIKFKSLSSPASANPPTKPEPEPLLLPEPELKNSLLEDISQCQRILIVGAQDDGKTTLLHHIAKQRSHSCVLVIDSHGEPDAWNFAYRVIGGGRDYEAIEQELRKLLAIMDSRYKELWAGKVRKREHPLITVVSDEWTLLSKKIKDFGEIIDPLLTESRKVAIDFVLATHSETAESLGLKGRFDLKKNFDAILRLKQVNNERVVETTIKQNESRLYKSCGIFYEPNHNHFMDAAVNPLDKKLEEDAIKEQGIIDTYQQLIANNKFSWNALSKAIFGYSNSRKINEIRAVLKAHNIPINQ